MRSAIEVGSGHAHIPRRRRPSGGPGLAAGALMMTALLAACGGGGKPTNSLTATSTVGGTSAPPTTSATPTPVLTATQAKIVDQYRAFWAAVEQASATNDVNSAALRATAAGNEFVGLVDNMVKDSGAGTTHRGTVDLDPGVPVVASDGLSATLRDCQDSSHFLPYRNGELVAPGVARRDGVVATLWLVNGVWKVVGAVVTTGRCDGT